MHGQIIAISSLWKPHLVKKKPAAAPHDDVWVCARRQQKQNNKVRHGGSLNGVSKRDAIGEWPVYRIFFTAVKKECRECIRKAAVHGPEGVQE